MNGVQALNRGAVSLSEIKCCKKEPSVKRNTHTRHQSLPILYCCMLPFPGLVSCPTCIPEKLGIKSNVIFPREIMELVGFRGNHTNDSLFICFICICIILLHYCY
jgi:hypothetical protein